MQFSTVSLKYKQLKNLIPPEREIHYNLRAVRFSSTYLQYCVQKRNLLDVSTRSCQSISEFERELLGRIRPPKRPTFNTYDTEGIKLLILASVSLWPLLIIESVGHTCLSGTTCSLSRHNVKIELDYKTGVFLRLFMHFNVFIKQNNYNPRF